MIRFSLLIPFLIFDGILEVRSVERTENITVNFDYIDVSISRTAFYFQRATGLSLTKRMEDFQQAKVIGTYLCDLTEDGKPGEQSYKLVREKISMPDSKFYTRLLLKLKEGEKEVNIPLATYSDFEYYPLPDPNIEDELNEYIASDTRLYVKKSSSPTNLGLLVFGLYTRRFVGLKQEAELSAYHTINFKLHSNAATITFKSNGVKHSEQSVSESEKEGEYLRLDVVCKKHFEEG